MGVGWIATITDLMCVAAILGALLAHTAWLQHRRLGSLLASVGLLAVAFPCKETAAVAPAALVALSFFLPDGTESQPVRWSLRALWERGWRLLRDPLSWVPAVAALAVFLGGYRAFELGGMNNLLYLDPMVQPAAYAAVALPRMAVLWLATLTPIPPSLTMFTPWTLVPLAIAGGVLLVAFGWALWPSRSRGVIAWAGVLYLVALLPQVGTDASERALYFPYLFAAVLLASLLVPLRVPFARWRGDRPAPSRREFWVGWNVAAAVLIPGLLLSATMPAAYVGSLQKPEQDALTALPIVEDRDPDPLYVLATAGLFSTFYTGGVLSHHHGELVDVYTLFSGNAVVSVERTGPRELLLRADRGSWMSNPFARIVRTDPVLHLSRTYETPRFTATLEQLTQEGDDVLAVRFVFVDALDAPGQVFVAWGEEGYELVDVAGLAVGVLTPLSDTSDVWGSMM